MDGTLFGRPPPTITESGSVLRAPLPPVGQPQPLCLLGSVGRGPRAGSISLGPRPTVLGFVASRNQERVGGRRSDPPSPRPGQLCAPGGGRWASAGGPRAADTQVCGGRRPRPERRPRAVGTDGRVRLWVCRLRWLWEPGLSSEAVVSSWVTVSPSPEPSGSVWRHLAVTAGGELLAPTPPVRPMAP